MSLGDSVIVMNEGRIMQKGAPTEIYARPKTKFVAEFVGRGWCRTCCPQQRSDLQLAESVLVDDHRCICQFWQGDVGRRVVPELVGVNDLLGRRRDLGPGVPDRIPPAALEGSKGVASAVAVDRAAELARQ